MSTADRIFDTGLLSPVTAGADGSVSDAAIRLALVDVEVAYLRALEASGIAPAGLADRMAQTPIPPAAGLAQRAVLGGNPVIPLLADLREHLPDDVAAWVHKGATSQDILDSALMLTAHRARAIVLECLAETIEQLARLADTHRGTTAAARTLTQHSTPTTWGLRFATWLGTVLDARDDLAGLELPAQLGGASGTLASLVALSDGGTAARMPALFAAELGLAQSPAWHTSRAPVTRLGDSLVAVTSALGVIASNVSTLGRAEIGEVAEPSAHGRGGSSAMPQKQNPVLSVLIRSAALRAPALASTLHLCAAMAIDERPDGAWHAEWPTLRELLRLALGASTIAAELVTGLTVDADRARHNLELSGDDILAERASLTGTTGTAADYVGLSDALIDAALARARS
ncbi:lyase family protein [Agreia pratensis]|uniref:lyase family protein n=1 Tax=Agreia pratensis TaxID=150121 RepID=UPI001E54D1DA|nr:lyase family protein [Agreia pratensis]